MENITKIQEKLDSLFVETGSSWLVVPNISTEITPNGLIIDYLKIFVCGSTGEVREFPHENFEA